MLRLVDRLVEAAPELRRIGLYGFERELERYVVGAPLTAERLVRGIERVLGE